MTKRQMQAEIAALKDKIAGLEGDLAVAKATQVNWYPSNTASTMTYPVTWYPPAGTNTITWPYQFPAGGSV